MPREANRLFPQPLLLCAVIVATVWVFHAACTSAASADNWPQFRGPNRDGVWSESGVLESFPADGVKVRWRKPVGPGWSTPVVADGRVFVTDVQLATNPAQERIHCLDATTGESRWSYAYDADYPDFARTVEHASPPTATPIVEQGRVYFTGGTGQVHCLQASTGKLLWEKQLAAQYEISTLSCRASPLVEGDLLIVVAGGKPGAYLVALDKNSGREVWHALEEAISNSSPIVITAAGTRQLIVWTSESVTALAPTTGELLWRERLLTSSNDGNATPVARENRLLISGLMFELAADRPGAKALWPKSRAVARRVLSNTSTPLVRDDHVYSARTGGELVSLDARTGEQVWTTDKVTGLKSGASIHLVADGDATWLFTDEGNLILARLTPQGYQELGRAHLLEPTSFFSGKLLAWVPPAFANRHVYARNDKEIVCASLAAKSADATGEK
jgi:outer membrane protein assembly factor BamB